MVHQARIARAVCYQGQRKTRVRSLKLRLDSSQIPHPSGMLAISRWLGSATPPERCPPTPRSPEGAQPLESCCNALSAVRPRHRLNYQAKNSAFSLRIRPGEPFAGLLVFEHRGNLKFEEIGPFGDVLRDRG